MRKFLTILLIAAIACVEVSNTKVENEDFVLDLDDVEFNWLTDIFSKIGNVIKGAWNAIKKGIDWLKEKGIWTHLVTVLKTVGKTAAITVCSTVLTPVVCGPLIGALL